METNYTWNRAKAEKNLRKHGVSFDEAKTVESDPHSFFEGDESDEDGEDRYRLIGYSCLHRILLVVLLDREVLEYDGTPIQATRIISARLAEPSEVAKYEANLPLS